MEKKEFLKRFSGILTDTWDLFKRKNEQDASGDALANFSAGANLRYGEDNPEYRCEALKDYMAKHIAHVYNNDIFGAKVRESLGDIAVYSIIGMIMYDEMKELEHINDILDEEKGRGEGGYLHKKWKKLIMGDGFGIIVFDDEDEEEDEPDDEGVEE